MFKYNIPLAFIFQPKSGIKAACVLCVVEYVACLIHKVVADYVKRIRQARRRQANEGGTGNDENSLKYLISDLMPDLGLNFLF